MTIGLSSGQPHDRRHERCSPPATSDNFTIIEGTSEIQHLIIGRAVTGLGARSP
jgi:alkylation response protein AidB-like acyl-CoA dehydrogenase